jgi:carbonic anhydrase
MRKLIVAACVAFVSLSALGQAPPLPENHWRDLMEGNKLFVQGQVVYGNLPFLRSLWLDGQNPPVSIVSCSDSRVPAEIVFGRTVGEMFVARVAGNVEDAYNIASLEYAVKNKWTRLIVVMGHSRCGAVEAAVDDEPAPTPALGLLISRIQHSFTTEDPDVKKATIDNVCYTVAQLRSSSETLRNVPMKMAYFDIGTGVVTEIAESECGTKPATKVCGLDSPKSD